MFKAILVATDGSNHADKALDIACDLALKYGAKLTIMSAYRHHSVPGSTHALVGGATELARPDETLGQLARDIVDLAIKRANEKGVKAEGMVRRGPLARTIVQVAKEKGADAIAMGSRGAGDIEGFLLGSVSHKVSSLAECTCITVK